MSDWPPKPENDIQNTQHNTQNITGKEWHILEKAVLASVEEQRRARRWGIFFKCLTFAYILFVLVLMGKSCSTSTTDPTATTSSHIAVVDIIGTIAADKQSVNSADTVKALKKAFESKQSQAVVLNINSPGGSPVQSDEIWQEIQYLKKAHTGKKLYAVIGDTGASGAYYIASAADEIIVNPSSLVGSIGVIMPNYGVTGLMQKLGVEDRTMTSGENKALLSMTQPVDGAQKAHVQGVLDNVHDHFINAVKQGRGNKLKSQDPAIFSGLFWTGDQAVKLGIADRTGSLNTLKRELKIDKAVNYTIEYSPFDSVLGRIGSSIGQGFASSLSQQVQSEQTTKLQ
ncbi:MAG: signal peptide peptidase SppA [Acinetobacter bohemicus]|jgi:protease-4|uniref:Signal peptide peptidase SppA, 36K type n=2 Tax=Acinetobacter bohemicus TaxID=1435036 RepID=N8Q733_9GAMM|nr:signal peptide peptidase SppA [Acinetobacter bohemicus]MBO6151870.1 signal peptide peptidase SppA [Acinetobacter sp.]ENU19018.1 signal peptide peptidase SppA, 36K type [Acinetobacter bohemicus ANC 3994]KAB0653097.1 signal peptide peptidase SppA [Acinetobacter bohemicus]CAD9196877.1 Signal peptide peptidase SppA, 36K type [Acinetobacter bohemicus]SFS98013.1 protease-4 [Acinetobacter bohemicus]